MELRQLTKYLETRFIRYQDKFQIHQRQVYKMKALKYQEKHWAVVFITLKWVNPFKLRLKIQNKK